jgi:hypothetical protein
MTQVLEAVLSKVAGSDAIWEVVLHEFERGLREQHLPAVGSGHHALDGAERQVTSILAVHELSLPGVDTHSNAERLFSPGLGVQILLPPGGGAHCITGSVERHTEAVANELENEPVLCLHGRAQDRLMTASHCFPRAALLLGQPGAAFYVGEEERNGTCGQTRIHQRALKQSSDA